MCSHIFKSHQELDDSVKQSSSYHQQLSISSYLSDILMMFITIFLLIVSSYGLVSCEWVQISQSPRTSHGIGLNSSIVMKNSNIQIVDYSKYTDFFSYINPKLDLVEVNQSAINIIHKNQSRKNDEPTILSTFSEVLPPKNDKPIGKNDGKIEKPIGKNDESGRNSTVNFNESRIVLKPFSFDEIIKFFRNMQQSFSLDNSAEGIQNKTKLLNDFQNGILIDIGLFEK